MLDPFFVRILRVLVKNIAMMHDWIFGYGSLVNTVNLQQYLQRTLQQNSNYKICQLNNFQRCWNVAMDNRLDLPEYKYYRDRNNVRFTGYVVFLNIIPSLDLSVTGILFRVDQKELKNLDLRERNYRRIDVQHQINVKVTGNVWTYIGLKEAEQRYQTGLTLGKAIIDRNYLESVQNAYLSLSREELINYFATTEQPQIPIADLKKCLL